MSMTELFHCQCQDPGGPSLFWCTTLHREMSLTRWQICSDNCPDRCNQATRLAYIDRWLHEAVESQGGPSGSVPGALVLAYNRLKAEIRDAANNRKRVSEATRHNRISQCMACPHRKDDPKDPIGRCTLRSCGCYLNLKVETASEACTDQPPRWGREE